MAEDSETAEEEAQATPEEEAKGPGRPRRTVEKPLSLYPLTFEEAIGDLLQVKMEPGELKK